MTDCLARRDIWSCDAPLRVGSVTMIAVVRIVRRAGCGDRHTWLSIEKAPQALIVCDANGVHALDTSGHEIALEPLRRRVPGLDACLTSTPAGPSESPARPA